MKEQKKKKIIIIGAGISGLSSGIYAQKSGFISEIFERNMTPGGLCTSWVRKGYKLDGCVHWLTGTSHQSDLYNLWRSIDAFDDNSLIMEDNFVTIEVDGVKVTLWHDLDKLEKELIEISPEDTKLIKKFIKDTKRIVNVPLPYVNSMSDMSIYRVLKTGIMMVPYLPLIIKCLTTSVIKFSNKFKSPILRKVFATIMPGNKSNLYQALYAFGTCASDSGGVPYGGSLAMANRIANNYEHLGGFIHYGKSVKEIIIKKNKAVGIRLTNGEEHYADYVISSTDLHHSINTLLNNQYYFRHFSHRFKNEKNYPSPSCVLVHYSVDLNKFNDLNITNTFEFETTPFIVGNSAVSSIRMRCYKYDKTFINNGRVTMNVLIHQDDDDFPFWNELNKNKPSYNQFKKEIGLIIKQKIEERFPSLFNDLELLDVVTPMTFVRYTNAYHGAYMCWGLTNNNSMLIHNGKVPGVKNLFISGQWLQMPGGLPIAMMSGKFAIDHIIKKEYQFPIINLFRTIKNNN
ncbi:MAG: NAD(P)/FAD-dependent oxidoreductase [Bacillales bacterium]|nr:NAD(P)/FAD-dependent oxidoreductase [Bacillales bacterium]MDY6003214.1 NAD(P)/FAD-dependent oxidoreductase [Bacilli bacterium]